MNTIPRHQFKSLTAMVQNIRFLLGLSPVEGCELHADLDGGALSSNGGVLVLRQIERRMGVTDVLASCLADLRDLARKSRSMLP